MQRYLIQKIQPPSEQYRPVPRLLATGAGEGRRRLAVLGMLLITLLGSASVLAADGGIESLRQSGKAFASVAGQVSPSVVNIQTEGGAGPMGADQPPGALPFNHPLPYGEDFFERFFGDRHPGLPQREAPRSKRQVVGQGSGFIFSPKSGMPADKTYILTNNHVVENAAKIRVKLRDGREFEATITGRDPHSDIAIIEIPTTGLPPLPLADSSRLDIGEWVIAVGNPFGLSHTVTVGVVSATGRTSLGINDYEDFIQTDAAINPGNSGGPLINLDAEVVGMNTAIVSRSGGYMGVGFAIPSNLIGSVADQLIQAGEVTRGYLGILIQQLTPELAQSFGLGQVQGILVAQVTPGSPAAVAGLRQGDVIIGHQGETVTDVGAFRNRIALTPPGGQARISILRNGQTLEVPVTIGTLTEEALAASGTRPGQAQDAEALGLKVQTLTPQLAEQFDVTVGEGVVVTTVKPGSVAAQAGIEPGTLILQVNQQPVKDAASFKLAIEHSPDQRALLLLRKGSRQQFLVLNWR
jgi:serine protease Do